MESDESKDMDNNPGFQRLLARLKDKCLDSCNTGELDGFGLEAYLMEWLEKPQDQLGGKKPAELLGTEKGELELHEILAQICESKAK